MRGHRGALPPLSPEQRWGETAERPRAFPTVEREGRAFNSIIIIIIMNYYF